MEIVGEARDGREGIAECERLRPDVVTLDIVLPGMSGVAVTEQIMAWCPTPIVVVSSADNRGELFRTYDALAAGALDAVEKPGPEEPEADWGRRLAASVRLASRVGVITHIRGRRAVRAAPPDPALAEGGEPALVAIGASTGGPSAVRAILRELPADFPLPILLVIHLSAVTGDTLAEWLDGQVRLAVRSAVEGEPLPRAGQVVMAPADRHLVLRAGRLRLLDTPPLHACRPSVDALFASVAAELGGRGIGCLLTGMGRDGAEGLAAIRRAGGATLAQDEATSVVFGMPKEAIARGAAARVLPLEQFAPALQALAWRAQHPPPKGA
jgi:two-component system chemotaxis response regulator CheB